MLNSGGARNDENRNPLPAADRMRRDAQFAGMPRNHAETLPDGDAMTPRRSRFKEPSSWGSLGAMVLAIGMMEPVNQAMIVAGIVFCALGIVLRERK